MTGITERIEELLEWLEGKLDRLPEGFSETTITETERAQRVINTLAVNVLSMDQDQQVRLVRAIRRVNQHPAQAHRHLDEVQERQDSVEQE